MEKKTPTAVAAVAHAEPAPAFRSPGLSLGASPGNVNLKNKGSRTMVALARRRMLEALLRQRILSFQYHLAQEECQAQTIQEEAFRQMIQVYQALVIDPHLRQVFQFAMAKPDDGGDGDDSGGDSEDDGD